MHFVLKCGVYCDDFVSFKEAGIGNNQQCADNHQYEFTAKWMNEERMMLETGMPSEGKMGGEEEDPEWDCVKGDVAGGKGREE